MSERTAPPLLRPRVNPFAFPSETTLRFVLLVIFVICGSAEFYGDFRGPPDQATKECTAKVFAGLSTLAPSTAGDNQDAETTRAAIVRCGATLRPAALWKLGGMVLVILVAAAFYYLYPAWKLRTGRLEPISSAELPELEHELRSIVQTARLSEPLVFVWNPLATGLPVVFGHRGKYYVALSGSFIVQNFYRDRDSFRAILLHEMAHIHNGDVHKTYFTMSLCLAFITTTLAPALLVVFYRLATLRWMDAAPLLLSGILWTGVIVLSGLAVLRAREYYADVRASVWGQVRQIDRVLAALSAPAGEGWRRYLQFHPHPRERRQVVEDPSRLLGLNFAGAFGIGIAAWEAAGVVSKVLMPFTPEPPAAAFVFVGSVAFIVPAVVFVFAIGAIGIGVWRNTFASLLRGDVPSKGTGWLGAAFVAGALPGLVMLLAAMVLESFSEHSLPIGAVLTTVALKAMAYIVLLAGCLLVFRWISQAASAWFEVVLLSRSPRPILLSSVATALALVVITLAMATTVVGMSFLFRPWQSWGPGWFYTYGLAAGGPLLVASVAAWAFPLAALWWRKQIVPARSAPWVFLDDASPRISTQEAVRSKPALLTGIVVGLVYSLPWQLLWLRPYLPAEMGDWIYAFFDWLFAWSRSVLGSTSVLRLGSAVLFQALAAAIVAGHARRLSVVCGLFAASVAGFFIVVGDFVFWINAGSRVSLWAMGAVATMGLGAVVALPMAIVSAWIANVARRLAGLAKHDPRPAL
jgi:Zn-dependent protease with chaperone function